MSSHEIRPATLLAVVGVVVAALVVVTVWAVTRGGGQPVPGPTHTTVAGPGEDSAFDVPQVPTVEARGTTGAVAFSWSYAGAQKGDTFKFRWARTLDQLPQAKIPPSLKTSTTVVKVPKRTQVCGQARVIRGGSESAWSVPQCERAG